MVRKKFAGPKSGSRIYGEIGFSELSEGFASKWTPNGAICPNQAHDPTQLDLKVPQTPNLPKKTHF